MKFIALRTAVIAATLIAAVSACNKRPPTTPTCTLTVAPASRTFAAEGGTQALEITASAPSCSWTATASASWPSIASPTSGIGSGVVTYSVGANLTTEPRSATIHIGTETHSILQAGSPPEVCTYAVEPKTLAVESPASAGQITLATAARCPWEALSTVPWIVLTSAASGTGPATISFSIEANRRESARSGAITVGGERVDVTQAGEEQPTSCSYSVAPVAFSPCMGSGVLVTRITTADRCSWTVASDVPWLTVLSGVSGAGSADIRAEFSSNYDAPRLGRLLVRWPTETAGQNVQVRQAGCRYAVSRSRIDFAATGGSGTFDVLQQSDPTECGGATQDRCVWSAVADVDWIEITSAMPRSGDNPVSFTVRANASGQTRTGRIVVRDQTVTVVQAGQ